MWHMTKWLIWRRRVYFRTSNGQPALGVSGSGRHRSTHALYRRLTNARRHKTYIFVIQSHAGQKKPPECWYFWFYVRHHAPTVERARENEKELKIAYRAAPKRFTHSLDAHKTPPPQQSRVFYSFWDLATAFPRRSPPFSWTNSLSNLFLLFRLLMCWCGDSKSTC